MNKKLKIIVSTVLLSLSISSVQANPIDFALKHPYLSALGVGGALYMGSAMHKAKDLSYHLSKVDNYFKVNPQDFNPVAKYVLWALANPANKSDYNRYKKLAQMMGLNNIPTYSPPKVNNPNVLTNPQQEQNVSDNTLENPVQEQQFSNIIYTPQGKKLDTSTEFPYEKPKNWKEYLLLKQDSTILGNNMVNSGQQRPDNTGAHHIVSATSPDAQDARDILEKYLRNTTPVGEETFNNEINGVFLPNINNTDPNIPGILHNGRHPQDYNVEVNQLIKDADAQGGWIEVQKTLNDIKQSLLNANRTDKWKNMP